MSVICEAKIKNFAPEYLLVAPAAAGAREFLPGKNTPRRVGSGEALH